MLNKNIKTLREIRNFKQDYMAKMLGISQPAYSKIEQGTVDVSSTMIFKIAKILDVPAKHILEFDTETFLKNSLDSENLHQKMLAVLTDIHSLIAQMVNLLTPNKNE